MKVLEKWLISFCICIGILIYDKKINVKNYSLELSVSTDISDNIIKVNKQSKKDLFEEVYKLAEYFKEEVNYDFIPFCLCGDLQEEYKVLLFAEEALDLFTSEPMPYRIYGACTFAIQKFKQEPNQWMLKWIWFHPFLEIGVILRIIGIN